MTGLVNSFHSTFKRAFTTLAAAGIIFAATPSAHTETIADNDQSPHQDKETVQKDINTKDKLSGIEISIQMYTGETIYAGIITIENNYGSTEIEDFNIKDDFLYNLAESISRVNPSVTTSDVYELLKASMTFDPQSDVKKGWEIEYEDHHFYFFHVNGWPRIDYDQFIGSPDHNTAKIAFIGPLAHLEVDGEPGYNPQTDATITIDENDPFVDAAHFNATNTTYSKGNMPRPEAFVYTSPTAEIWMIQ